MNAAAGRAAREAFRAERILRPGWARGALFGVLALLGLLAVLACVGCTATVTADNTPFGKVTYGATQEAPPPIYSKSSRSTTTRPPPTAPEVEETACESGVCGVPGR